MYLAVTISDFHCKIIMTSRVHDNWNWRECYTFFILYVDIMLNVIVFRLLFGKMNYTLIDITFREAGGRETEFITVQQNHYTCEMFCFIAGVTQRCALYTMAHCVVRGCSIAKLLRLTCMCVSTQAALLQQLGSCLPYLFAWSLPLIIINKYDDMVFLYPSWKS